MRTDISDTLIHFTKAADSLSAYDVLRKIIRERRLIAGNRLMRASETSVCFSEAPLSALATSGFVNSFGTSRYEHYGIAFSKKFVFARGGRPVIYQPDSEYALLPENLRWRHVRFELGLSDRDVDFTWEREWRIRCERLTFLPADTTVIVPDEPARLRLQAEIENESFYDASAYTAVLGDEAWALDDGNPWSIVTLNDARL